MDTPFVTLDGNEAAARIAHLASEVICIYPITPASPMGELADAWSRAGRENLWGTTPQVLEMQSEGGAAGAVHGALQGGALATTFTASQGLLLMIPNLFKIAGELTPAVFHVAARTVATHALSIFGDHSDVMAARAAGWGMLASSSVQECQDLAAVAHAATLESRVPFLHFFDGFRTSHEMAKIALLDQEDFRALIDERWVRAHRERALSPDRPVLRGSAQNPDVFFQAREAANPFYDRVPAAVQGAMDRLAARTGRAYRLFEYAGHPEAERVVVLMGSGVGAAAEAVETLVARGERVGMVTVRLYRPFAVDAFLETLPPTARAVAALDRTKEPGAVGEPLLADVAGALVEAVQTGARRALPTVVGGRYGLSSKEFTPSMVAAIFDELANKSPKRRFTVGIYDDVTRLSLPWDADRVPEPEGVRSALFWGLGSDGTVGAAKSTVRILGEETPLHAQGHFVYDSKKSGSVTVSHLRFGPKPIRSTYLVRKADFIGCHQFDFLFKTDVLAAARRGATLLVNSPHGPDEVWERMPVEAQRAILDKEIRLFVIDAYAVAGETGLGGRINTVMQPCFFALSGVLPRDEAIACIKTHVRKTYGKRGETVLRRNFAAVDAALGALHEVPVPGAVRGDRRRRPVVPAETTDFVRRVTARILDGQGDLLPVSALPVDGTFPTATARWEKRSIAHEIPIWDADLCIRCGLCALACPHAAIRAKPYPADALAGAPADFPSKVWEGKELAAPGEWRMTIQVAPDDCTGCGVCVEICPARSKEIARRKAIRMEPKDEHLDRERARFDFFLSLPDPDRRLVSVGTVKGSQMLAPLFEFSGACAGCGETPYLKLMSQLFGDRTVVANATGCSSIYGGNLPTTPWAADAAGRGPAWANSLFEDNAEFGLGIRMALDHRRAYALRLLDALAPRLGDENVRALADADQSTEAGLADQRARIAALKDTLAKIDAPLARELEIVADALARRDVWIVGGDGWAYDIGFGGLDHVLASGRDVNVLVLDTEVYSNTGGQASKATPRAAVAKFAAGGKAAGKKDLGMIAMAYGNVYVAHVALGANPLQTIKAFREAESYPGPSLLIAYSPCIAHGIDMRTQTHHQREAVDSGYWPLYRFDPRAGEDGGHPFRLDSRKPKIPFKDFAMKEARFAMLAQANPEHAHHLMQLAQADIDERRRLYEQTVGVERHSPDLEEHDAADADASRAAPTGEDRP